MITDEDAKILVADLRRVAENNKKKSQEKPGTWYSGHCDGRAAAYTLAAEWLEKLIPGKEKAE